METAGTLTYFFFRSGPYGPRLRARSAPPLAAQLITTMNHVSSPIAA